MNARAARSLSAAEKRLNAAWFSLEFAIAAIVRGTTEPHPDDLVLNDLAQRAMELGGDVGRFRLNLLNRNGGK